jgi:hypothetical protein
MMYSPRAHRKSSEETNNYAAGEGMMMCTSPRAATHATTKLLDEQQMKLAQDYETIILPTCALHCKLSCTASVHRTPPDQVKYTGGTMGKVQEV